LDTELSQSRVVFDYERVVLVSSGCEKEAALDLHELLLVLLPYERNIERFLLPDLPCRILWNVLSGR
jgi:hypothetical protein